MKAFISYSHRDAGSLERLHVHLATLRRDKLISEWFDRDILAGDVLDAEITKQLETCDVFLLLVSPDFLASDYCVEREMTRALERHRAGSARVVPIIIEPCDWKASPLRELKAVPKDGNPVSEWTNANNAYLDIVRELRRIVENDMAVSAKPAAPVALGEAERVPVRRYRVKRDFDEIDKSEFRERAFAEIANYFRRAIAEIDSIEDLRGRFRELSATSFGCTIVNRARDRGTAHLTVHVRHDMYGMGDIYYSFAENSPANTASGGFSIGEDEFDLFLNTGHFGFRDEKERLTPVAAAESLWTDFLQQAGVTCD